MGAIILLWVVMAIACASYTATVADSKGQSNLWRWALGGLLFGPIALLAAGLSERESVAGKEKQLRNERETKRLRRERETEE